MELTNIVLKTKINKKLIKKIFNLICVVSKTPSSREIEKTNCSSQHAYLFLSIISRQYLAIRYNNQKCIHIHFHINLETLWIYY